MMLHTYLNLVQLSVMSLVQTLNLRLVLTNIKTLTSNKPPVSITHAQKFGSRTVLYIFIYIIPMLVNDLCYRCYLYSENVCMELGIPH